MNPLTDNRRHITRRALLGKGATGVGLAALSYLFRNDFASAVSNTAAGPVSNALAGLPHFAPKAKRVIYMFQNGAPSHVDLFDYKPKLREWYGKEIPPEVQQGKRLSTMTSGQKAKPVLPEITNFKQHGKSGAWVSDFLPETAGIADDLCFIKSMHTGAVNHAPAITFFLTGGEQPGRPSMGSWLTYGLGSTSENLPAFVVMTSRDKEASCGQIFYDFYWGSGFLPSKYQGVKFRGSGDPVLYLSDPDGMSREIKRGLLDDIAAINEMKLKEIGDPEIATRISQYEMAFKMQTSVPDLMDLSQESKETLAMYGTPGADGSFAANCLLARRLAERGVRFIQCYHRDWDHHGNIKNDIPIVAKEVDQAAAALIKDLKQRGMLDETLVLWGGEFGRTPMAQGDGRDHHIKGFSVWMAGGGVKGGVTYGSTDDLGYAAQENIVQVHDLHATMLHQLGIDHKKLTYKFQGRDFRLTDVSGNVVKAILA